MADLMNRGVDEEPFSMPTAAAATMAGVLYIMLDSLGLLFSLDLSHDRLWRFLASGLLDVIVVGVVTS